jgi:hypothetical protein
MRSLILILLLAPALAVAQGSLEPGARIRILNSAPGHEPWRTGSVVSVAGDSAVITMTGAQIRQQVFPLSRLEVARGKRTHGQKGAAIGAATGLVVGFIAGYSSGSNCSENEIFVCFDKPTSGGLGAVIGAFYGMVAGGVAGRLIKTDRWVSLGGGR